MKFLHMRVEFWAKHYSGPKFHALLCDPPYELGFMGKTWDNTGIAYQPETWAALAEHLHPGAFGMAFASSRGWHRLAVAIEDAGLRIHPSLFLWGFGSGFPKATRVRDNGKDVEAFKGHRYGGQAIKPAAEPIIVFQKPYAGRPVDDIVESGAGALNIEGGRVGAQTDSRRPQAVFCHSNDPTGVVSGSVGKRWPSNLILQHTPDCRRVGTRRVQGDKRGATGGKQNYKQDNPAHYEVVHSGGGMTAAYGNPDGQETIDAWICSEQCPVAALGRQSGEKQSGRLEPHHVRSEQRSIYGKYNGKEWGQSFGGDTGTAARFFYQAHWSLDIAERLDAADPVRYVAKASRGERDGGLSGEASPVPYKGYRENMETTKSHVSLYPDGSPRPMNPLRNPHPTIKPIALTEYLATLLLPPDAYAPRRILIPFAGSGSEVIGAWRAGWEHAEGIESHREYVQIARARLEWWQRRGVQLGLFDEHD